MFRTLIGRALPAFRANRSRFVLSNPSFNVAKRTMARIAPIGRSLRSVPAGIVGGDVLPHYNALDEYLNRGRALASDSVTMKIINEIKQDIDANHFTKPASAQHKVIFYFAEGSSGAGKSQLCFSLGPLKVVYIPLSNLQEIYLSFGNVHRFMKDAMTLDLNLATRRGMDLAASEINLRFKYHSYGGLLAIMRYLEQKGASDCESSLRLLSQLDTSKMRYVPLTVQGFKNGLARLKGPLPLVAIDEVPFQPSSKSTSKERLAFDRVLLFRNLLRRAGVVSLLAGTESTLANFVDPKAEGSRGEDGDDFVKIIHGLPTTQINLLQTSPDDKIPSDMAALLARSRPYFTEVYLEVAKKLGHTAPLSEILSNMKSHIVSRRSMFGTREGLYGQTSLILSDTFNGHVASIEAMVKARAQPQAEKEALLGKLVNTKLRSVRHHYAFLAFPTSAESPITKLTRYGDALTCDGKEKFRFDSYFKLPSIDPLLYLIMFRDGLRSSHKFTEVARHGEYHDGTRVSVSHAFQILRGNDKDREEFIVFPNPYSPLNTGREFEVEGLITAVTASHGYNDALTGTPIRHFLGNMISELNPHREYVTLTLKGDFPTWLEKLIIYPLGPPNTTWRPTTTGDAAAFNALVNKVKLGIIRMVANAEQIDAKIRDENMSVVLSNGDHSSQSTSPDKSEKKSKVIILEHKGWFDSVGIGTVYSVAKKAFDKDELDKNGKMVKIGNDAAVGILFTLQLAADFEKSDTFDNLHQYCEDNKIAVFRVGKKDEATGDLTAVAIKGTLKNPGDGPKEVFVGCDPNQAEKAMFLVGLEDIYKGRMEIMKPVYQK